jgi:hypothetical protein
VVTGPAVAGRPLAPQQRGLWFLQQLRPGSPEYNLQIALRLRGPLRVGCLRNALYLLVLRHEPLRTRIAPDESGTPRQYVSPAVPLPLVAEPSVADPAVADPAVADPAVADPDKRVTEVLWEEVTRPFDLAAEWPIRVRLVALADDDHLLVMTFHHLAMDGVSLSIVSAELSSGYAALAAGEPVALPPLAVSFTDYAEWLAGQEVDPAGLEFWRQELAGVGDLALPADRAGHGVGASMIMLRREVPAETVRDLTRLARDAGTSLFAVTLSCYALLLHRSSGQRDFAIGLPVAGRTEAACQPLVGCLLNTVCVRIRIDPDRPVRQLVRQTAGALARSLQHQSVPFGEVVRSVRPDRANTRHPLFSAFCSVLDEAPPGFAMAGVATEVVVADYPIARFDLNATFALGLAPPSVQLEFSDALFAPATAHRLADRLVRVLDWVAADPDRPVAAVPLVGRAERTEVLDLLNRRSDG